MKTALLSFDEIRQAMAYLGYNPGPQTDAVARALQGKVATSPMLPSLIATEYAKHNADGTRKS